ncbi:putative alternative splicing factor [Balamuthia mandrillaris]
MVWWWTFGQVPELEGREIMELVEAKKKGAQDCPEFQIVDVRTLSEYHAGHIEGAIHCSLFPPWSFHSRLERLNLNREAFIIAICLTAHRSISAQKVLTDMGFRCKQLKGGMQQWRKDGLPEVSYESEGESSCQKNEGEEQLYNQLGKGASKLLQHQEQKEEEEEQEEQEEEQEEQEEEKEKNNAKSLRNGS